MMNNWNCLAICTALLMAAVTVQSLQGNGTILCPFIKAAQPDTSSWSSFLSDLNAAGCTYPFCTSLTVGATTLQKPFNFDLHVVDIYRLGQIPHVSHKDLFNSQTAGVNKRINEYAMNNNGMVTLQDLVDIKLWVVNVTSGVSSPGFFSKRETCLLFLRSGGDLISSKVLGGNVITMLAGQFPNGTENVAVGYANLCLCERMTNWG